MGYIDEQRCCHCESPILAFARKQGDEDANMRLKDKIALITGAGEGIGRAIALSFAKEGAKIIIADINPKNAKKVSEEIIALGSKSLAIKTDVSKQKAVIPYMLKQKSGKIINLSSQSGKKGNSWYAAYCASKFGIIGLTQSLALEFAPYGINVNALCPNVVFTSMWKRQLNQYAQKYGLPPKKVKDFLMSKIPFGRFPRLEEIANVALFLASEESSYITGQSINVTGGQQLI